MIWFSFFQGIFVGAILGIAIFATVWIIAEEISMNKEINKRLYEFKKDEVNLENLFLKEQIAVYEKYVEEIKKINGVKLPDEKNGGKR